MSVHDDFSTFFFLSNLTSIIFFCKSEFCPTLVIAQAALHALANISGENRSEDSIMLNDGAEECLRSLVYATAASSSKLTPSVSFSSQS